MKFHRALALPALLLLVVSSGASRAREASAKPATWHAQMRKVHARFKGKPGTFAHFGDSITYSMAFWTPIGWDEADKYLTKDDGLPKDDQPGSASKAGGAR